MEKEACFFFFLFKLSLSGLLNEAMMGNRQPQLREGAFNRQNRHSQTCKVILTTPPFGPAMPAGPLGPGGP